MFEFIDLSCFTWLMSDSFFLAAEGHSANAESGWLAMIIALLALSAMEIVLGIDNIVFLSIVTSKLPPEQQKKARYIGLALALIMRVILLMLIQYIVGLKAPILQLEQVLPFLKNVVDETQWEEINGVSWRDLILLGGGLFLIFKSVKEIDHHMSGHSEPGRSVKKVSFTSAIVQIVLLDLVFSLDSVITAVGMADDLSVMVAAVIIAIVVMMVFAGKISRFVDRTPTVKMLALSFLLLIGVMLVAEGFGTHINKGYVYFAMAFALLVEILNLRARAKAEKAAATATESVNVG